MISFTGAHRWPPPLLRAYTTQALHRKPALPWCQPETDGWHSVCPSPDPVQKEDIYNAIGKPQAQNRMRGVEGP